MILGLDVSHHQDPDTVPYKALRERGFRFVIVRLAFGLSPDRTAPKHLEIARDCGYDTAGYTWLDPLQSARAQADLHASLAADFELPLLFPDIEQWWADWGKWSAARQGEIPWSRVPQLMASRIDSHAKAATTRLEKMLAGRHLGCYTARWFVNGYAPSLGYWIGKYPLWLAEYTIRGKVARSWAEFFGNVPKGRTPRLPNGVSADSVKVWQWTSSYRPPGVRIDLDLDLWLGSEVEYNRLFGREAPAAPQPESDRVIIAIKQATADDLREALG